jgi:hypothetical protein
VQTAPRFKIPAIIKQNPQVIDYALIEARNPKVVFIKIFSSWSSFHIIFERILIFVWGSQMKILNCLDSKFLSEALSTCPIPNYTS